MYRELKSLISTTYHIDSVMACDKLSVGKNGEIQSNEGVLLLLPLDGIHIPRSVRACLGAASTSQLTPYALQSRQPTIAADTTIIAAIGRLLRFKMSPDLVAISTLIRNGPRPATSVSDPKSLQK